MGETNKIWGFQGIRGIAIFFIMISHCTFYLNKHNNNAFMWLGALGVSLFLMMSGYLASMKYSINNYSIKDVPRQFIHKLKKVYPLHILTMIFALPLSYYVCFQGNNIYKEVIKILLQLFLLHSWIPNSGIYFSYNAVSWYLCVDLFCVLMTPLFVSLCKKLKSKHCILILLGIVAIQLGLVAVFQESVFAHWLVYVCPLVRSMDFGIGCLAYYVGNDKKQRLFLEKYADYILCSVYIVVIIVCVISMNSANEIFSSAIWTLFSFLTILVVGQNVKCRANMVFLNPVAIFMGNISFELFLFHQIIIRYSVEIYKRITGESVNNWVYVCALILSVVVAYIYHTIATYRKCKK